MGVLPTILIFVGVLALLVLVHEFGHFIAAKRAGIRVDEFGIGFPPRIAGKKWRGTLYTINWVPLGGFVKIKGVAGDDPDAKTGGDDADSFSSKSFARRLLILFAGIAMNVILAAVLLAITYTVGSTTDISQAKSRAIISNDQVRVTAVVPDGPAAKVGIEPGDTIMVLNGTAVTNTTDVSSQTEDAGETIELQVAREGTTRTVTLTTQEMTIEETTYIGMGVGLQAIGTIRYPWYQALWLGPVSAFEIIGEIFVSLWGMIGSLITSGNAGGDVAGPVGIAVLTGQVASLGIVELLQFMAILSANLAVFNLLPIPALDGGRIFFILIEGIRKKPVSAKLEAIVHNIGFLVLLGIVLLVTFKDVARFDLLSFLPF